MWGIIPEYHEFLSFLTIIHSLNEFNTIYRQNIPINQEKGYKMKETGGIFPLSVQVSKENHKLQFASNSCASRARKTALERATARSGREIAWNE